MLIPEILFSTFLRPQGRPPYIAGFRGVATGSATVITPSITMPIDMDAIIMAIAVEAFAGATQNPTKLQIQITVQESVSRAIARFFPTTSQLNHGLNVHTPIYAPKGSVIEAPCTFNSGTNSNGVNLDLYAFLIPPMNI